MALVLASALGHALPEGVTGYEAMRLGVLDGYLTSKATALDDWGRVVGRCELGWARGFVWINGDIIAVPDLPDQTMYNPVARQISSTNGLISGFIRPDPNHAPTEPAVWRLSPRGAMVLPPFPGLDCDTMGINDGGWVAGACYPTGAVAWVRGVPTHNLGTFGSSAAADDINELNEIVGVSDTRDRVTRPFIWRDGELIDIGGDDPTLEFYANRINNRTEVIGLDLQNRRWAFFWSNGVRTLLPEVYPCNFPPTATALNDHGLVVGTSAGVGCTSARVAIFDMNQMQAWIMHEHLIGDWNHVAFSGVADINNAGQMAMTGEEGNYNEAILVTPFRFHLSEPMPGIAGEVNTVTVSNLTPGQQVSLVWGTGEGALKIRPGCPGGTVLINDAALAPGGPVTADSTGVATFTLPVTSKASGRTFRLQAIAINDCEVSHTVTWTFE